MHIAIIGMGSMGPGMAARLARGGHGVSVHDTASAAMDRARSLQPMIATALDGLGITDTGGSISYVDTLASAVTGADLVLENVPENIDLKAALYRQLAPLLGPTTILATDTSGIPITTLQAHVADPARFVGMHWSNPPHIIPMIEVIAGAHTAHATVTAITALIRQLNLRSSSNATCRGLWKTACSTPCCANVWIWWKPG